MIRLRLWGYEARRCGAAALALPVLAAGLVVVTSVTAGMVSAAGGSTIGLGIVRLMTLLVPVAAGLAAAAALGRERMVELQLSVVTTYRSTVARRVGVVAAVMLLSTTAALIEAVATGHWSHPARGVLALLVPLGPAVLLIGVGAWAQIALRSTAGSSSFVVGAWLFQLLIFDRFVGVWQVNRTMLTIAGILLVLLTLRRLRDAERLLPGGTP